MLLAVLALNALITLIGHESPKHTSITSSNIEAISFSSFFQVLVFFVHPPDNWHHKLFHEKCNFTKDTNMIFSKSHLFYFRKLFSKVSMFYTVHTNYKKGKFVLKNDKLQLQSYIFRIQLIMIIVLSLVLGIVGIFINISAESRQIDRNLQNVAEAIAHSDPVHMAEDKESSDELIEYVDTLKQSLSDIDVISVVGSDNIRLYHSNHDLIGKTFDGTLPDFSANGSYYSINDTGPSGNQRRAYAAIYTDDGKLSGFVMAIMLMSNIEAKNIRTIIIFAVVIVCAILVELLISRIITKKIRDTLLGYEPDTFSTMFKVRENVLESLEEGIIAVNDQGNTEYINQSAKEMLGDNIDSNSLLSHTLESGKKEFQVPIKSSMGVDIIMDRIPVTEGDRINGALGILHNRTEYTRLAEDLAGTKFLVDSMRANNHDFTNKLHVILGLLQMERYKEARDYIENITVVQRETISVIMHNIGVSSVAALLIGKNARASELNIKFIFNKDSSYSAEDIYIPEDILITIIGNLIDNAFEAMNSEDFDGSDKEVCFGMYSSPGALLITVDDTGPGISEEIIDRIFENGFSTKGPGHGTGLYQIKKLIENYHGTISVQSQEGTGTSFTVSFTKEDMKHV